MITSLQNAKIKYVCSLKKRKTREKERKFIIEGIHLVGEAFKISKISAIIYSGRVLENQEGKELVSQIRGKGIENYQVTEKIIEEISEVENPQGILGVVEEEKFSLQDILASANPLIVFCHEVQDPANLGTIIRTADAAGANGVILSKGTVDLYNSKVLRGSMGSVFHLPIVYVDDIQEALKTLKKNKVDLLATALKANKNCYEIDYNKPIAILVGNEAAGLPDEIISTCDQVVKIPMLGKAESLNAAVSTAIVLYEAVRQRTKSK
jgi:TrmH family RNA methyltransferase